MSIPNPNVPANFPIIDKPAEVDDFLGNFGIFAKFTELQRVVLKALACDMMSEKPRTLSELASDLDCAVSSISYMKNNSDFATALGMLTIAVTRGNSPLYVRKMHELALEGTGHVARLSTQFLLEYGGVYTRRTRIDSRTLHMNQDSGSSSASDVPIEETVDEFLTMLGARGWSAERITARYELLKQQQAW